MNVAPFVGLPYQPNGCWHLVRKVYAEEFGIELPGYDDQVPAGTSRHDVAATIHAAAVDWSPVVVEQEGDVVLFRILGAASHVGIVLGAKRFLHAFGTNKTSRVDSYRSPIWAPRIEGFYRHVGHL